MNPKKCEWRKKAIPIHFTKVNVITAAIKTCITKCFTLERSTPLKQNPFQIKLLHKRP